MSFTFVSAVGGDAFRLSCRFSDRKHAISWSEASLS